MPLLLYEYDGELPLDYTRHGGTHTIDTGILFLINLDASRCDLTAGCVATPPNTVEI